MPSPQPTHHGYAVNVKDHSYYPIAYVDGLSAPDVERLYNCHVEMFWQEAEALAQNHGFSGIYSEGRMGGWAAPHPQPANGDMWSDELAEWMAVRFRPLEADLLALLADAREQFLADLTNEVNRSKRDTAEAAYWAARDVVTD